jgi:putative ABC transport system permease protein
VKDGFYLAARYLLYHRLRSATIVACVVLVAVLPLALERTLTEAERQLTDRAHATPLLLGSKGSALDLVLGAVYFGGQSPEPVPMAELERIDATDLGYAIPLHTRFSARGAPVVGTSVDYLDFRGLSLATGRRFAVLGECVLGAGVAERLALAPGDALISSPESVFDLAGAYPLKMRVVGVLEPGGDADDLAVFVDVKTAWVMQGLGHGHQDLARVRDPSLVIAREEGRVVGSAKVVEYQEITSENLESFHFHGGASEYPVTAALIVPQDERSGTLLLGRFVAEDHDLQLVRPRAIVSDLMETIFRIKSLLDMAVAIVGTAAVLALALVFALLFRLRDQEMRSNFELGASRGTTATLLFAELTLLAGVSALGVGAALLLLDRFLSTIVRSFFIT